MPNLAAEFATPLLGAGEIRPALTFAGLTAGNGFIERTGKGAIHVGIDTSHNAIWAKLNFPLLLADYIRSNPGHDMYFSIWEKVTRVGTAAESKMALTMSASAGPSELEVALGVSADYPASANLLGAYRNPNGSHLGLAAPVNSHVARGVSKYTGTIGRMAQSAIDNNMAKLWMLGNTGAFSGGASGGRSAALMRIYVEDLQVSGRTFAQVNAIDVAHFQRTVLTAGGRYYGDTYTNPTTLD